MPPKKQSTGFMGVLAYGSVGMAVFGLICFIGDYNFSYREVGSPPPAAWEQTVMLLLMCGAFFSFLIGAIAGIAPMRSNNETVQGFAMLGVFANVVLLIGYSVLTAYACSGVTFVT